MQSQNEIVCFENLVIYVRLLNTKILYIYKGKLMRDVLPNLHESLSKDLKNNWVKKIK